MLELTDLKTVKSLLTFYNVSAQKQLGQHFLIDKPALEAIVDSANLTKQDYVVEIGPGFGVLTFPLADKAGRVLAIETDKKIIEILKSLGSGYANLEILPSSILKLDNQFLHNKYKAWSKNKTQPTKYKLVANLPYYITSSIIKLFLETDNRPEVISIMVQKEVAERITAEPGEMSLLAVSVQLYSTAEIVRIVPRTSFWPAPEVDSAILKIVPFSKPRFEIDNYKMFFRIAKAGFGERRKQLHNSLSGGLNLDDELIVEILERVGIDPKTRAQDLSIDNWVSLYSELKNEL
ncbi:MAG: 16S rRNA (adenine(1518)-N(6)/adenine(1519)-N(6))-dimethyltransferase RsmA [Patescibacteria group bacterium]